MELVIRSFRPADVEGLFVLDYRSYKPPYRFGYSQMVQTLSDVSVTVLVIDDEAAQELVGGLIVRSNQGAREASVVSLMVEREHRRQGLGRRLLERAQGYVRTSGWERLVVPLERGNEGGSALLRAGGCRDSGMAQPYYLSMEEGTWWEWRPDLEAGSTEAAQDNTAASPEAAQDTLASTEAAQDNTAASAEAAQDNTAASAEAAQAGITSKEELGKDTSSGENPLGEGEGAS